MTPVTVSQVPCGNILFTKEIIVQRLIDVFSLYEVFSLYHVYDLVSLNDACNGLPAPDWTRRTTSAYTHELQAPPNNVYAAHPGIGGVHPLTGLPTSNAHLRQTPLGQATHPGPNATSLPARGVSAQHPQPPQLPQQMQQPQQHPVSRAVSLPGLPDMRPQASSHGGLSQVSSLGDMRQVGHVSPPVAESKGTHTHTHTHTHINPCVQHTYLHTFIHNMHAYIDTYINTYIHTYIGSPEQQPTQTAHTPAASPAATVPVASPPAATRHATASPPLPLDSISAPAPADAVAKDGRARGGGGGARAYVGDRGRDKGSDAFGAALNGPLDGGARAPSPPKPPLSGGPAA